MSVFACHRSKVPCRSNGPDYAALRPFFTISFTISLNSPKPRKLSDRPDLRGSFLACNRHRQWNGRESSNRRKRESRSFHGIFAQASRNQHSYPHSECDPGSGPKDDLWQRNIPLSHCACSFLKNFAVGCGGATMRSLLEIAQSFLENRPKSSGLRRELYLG